MADNYRFLVDLSARILASGGAFAHAPRTRATRSFQPANDPIVVRSVTIPAQNLRDRAQSSRGDLDSPALPKPAPRLASRHRRALVS